MTPHVFVLVVHLAVFGTPPPVVRVETSSAEACGMARAVAAEALRFQRHVLGDCAPGRVGRVTASSFLVVVAPDGGDVVGPVVISVEAADEASCAMANRAAAQITRDRYAVRVLPCGG